MTEHRVGHWFCPGGEGNPAWQSMLDHAAVAVEHMGGVEMVHTHPAGRSCTEDDCVKVEIVTEVTPGNEP